MALGIRRAISNESSSIQPNAGQSAPPPTASDKSIDITLRNPPRPPPEARLYDHQQLLWRSINRIACFAYDPPLSCALPRLELLEQLWLAPSVCIEANEVFAEALGARERGEVLGRRFSDVFPCDDETRHLFLQWIDAGFHLGRYEVIEPSRDGVEQHYFNCAFTGIIESRSLTRLWVVMRDVTELRRSVRRLTAAEHHYRTLVERPGLVLVRTAPDGKYIYISPHVQDVVGYPPESFQRNPGLFVTLIHPEDVEVHEAVLAARRLQSCEPVEIEYRVKHVDGTWHWILERQTAKCDEGGRIEYFDSIAIDIQERKELESKLLHAQKMELVGSLAGGIAHDFNNQLTAVLGQISLALRELKPTHKAYDHLTSAERSALDCAEIVKQLLSFSRRSTPATNALDISSALRDVVAILTHVLPSSIELVSHIPAEPLIAKSHPTLLQQIVMNLVINARDAMANGGRLTVSACSRKILDVSVQSDYPKAIPGDYIEVHVRDTGHGMRKDQLPHIFEPFYTTKPEGQGTGLGLSMVYSLVTNQGGWVRVESTEGLGTLFAFILPTTQQQPVKAKRPSQLTMGTIRRGILLVDDDDMVRSMAAAALSLQGFEVFSAADGEEGLRVYCDHADAISVALLDQTMPKLSGLELARRLAYRNARLPILITSGYSEQTDIASSIPSKRVEFLPKPYLLEDLFARLGELLGE